MTANLPAMLRFLLGRFGMYRAILITTLMTVAASVATTSVLMLSMGLPDLHVGMALAALCPAIVAPFMIGFYLRLIERLDRSNRDLRLALAEVKELRGLLPICSSCKKIRDDEGDWTHIESYIAHRSRAKFTHSICPDCSEALYGRYLQSTGNPHQAEPSD